MFDQRNQGDSEGEFSSASFFEKYDALGAFDYLVKRKIPEDKIALHGFSMGGATSILAASIEPRIKALTVIDSTFADARELLLHKKSLMLREPPCGFLHYLSQCLKSTLGISTQYILMRWFPWKQLLELRSLFYFFMEHLIKDYTLAIVKEFTRMPMIKVSYFLFQGLIIAQVMLKTKSHT